MSCPGLSPDPTFSVNVPSSAQNTSTLIQKGVLEVKSTYLRLSNFERFSAPGFCFRMNLYSPQGIGLHHQW